MVERDGACGGQHPERSGVGGPAGPPPAGPPWSSALIADVLLDALTTADRALTDEQAFHGVDAMDELRLHGVLAAGLGRAGWGVHREAPYPGDTARGDNDRDRCDLVLTPSPAHPLADPVHADRRVGAAGGTLFEPVAERMEAEASSGTVDPADACWLEVKVVGQHRYRHGVPGPNRAYSAELVAGPIADVRKLAGDGVISEACAVVVLFTETEGVARHDLMTMTIRLLEKDLPVGSPSIASGPIEDRAGNACVSVGVLPLRGIGEV